MSSSQMSASPSFHELFDENGHVKFPTSKNLQQQQLQIDSTNSNNNHGTNSSSSGSDTSQNPSSSRSHDLGHDTYTNGTPVENYKYTSTPNSNVMTTTENTCSSSNRSENGRLQECHSSAPQSQYASSIISNNSNNSDCHHHHPQNSLQVQVQQLQNQTDTERLRPHSSYCKTRSALNNSSSNYNNSNISPSLRQFNLSPVDLGRDNEFFLQKQQVGPGQLPITPPPSFIHNTQTIMSHENQSPFCNTWNGSDHHNQNTQKFTDTMNYDGNQSNKNMKSSLSSSNDTDAFSPPITQYSSLFLTDGPPPPPVPQASQHHDDDNESFLSLDPDHFKIMNNPYYNDHNPRTHYLDPPQHQQQDLTHYPQNHHPQSHIHCKTTQLSSPPPPPPRKAQLLHHQHTNNPNNNRITTKSKKSNTLLFSSVPLDALHCIAGFLTVKEWFTLGLISSEALSVCREVIHKVRMHGFKCAVEVIAAWELGEHSDANHLAALYLQNGVPIYPAPFGHAYHTLDWRMKIEAKQINSSDTTTNTDINDPTATDNTTPTSPESNNVAMNNNPTINDNNTETAVKRVKQVDTFYAEQINARRSVNGSTHGGHVGNMFGHQHGRMLDNDSSLTYLEKKGIYWRNVYYRSKGMTAERSNSPNRSSISRQPRQRPLMNVQQHHNTGGHGPIPARPAELNEVELFAFIDDDVDGFAEQGHFIGIPEDMVGQLQNNPDLPLPFDLGQRRSTFMPNAISPPSSRNLQGSVGGGGKSLNAKTKGLKIPVKCHRHLLNRHVQRLKDVDDEHGEMKSRDISMSADFFYPTDTTRKSTSSGSKAMLGRTLQQLRKDKASVTEHEIVSNLEIQPYTYDTVNLINRNLKCYSLKLKDCNTSQMVSLKEVVDHFEPMLLSYLHSNDYNGFNECMLDFWDVFLPVTALVHFYDKFTPVPRMSSKQQFLCQPCPKAFGTIQCEIERIKVLKNSRGVNVTSRIFPTYEYRLFIRDRRLDQNHQLSSNSTNHESPLRVDTVLMTAKHKCRSLSNSVSTHPTPGKKGVNNYHFYMPQQVDIDDHLQAVNDLLDINRSTEGYRQKEISNSNFELGRLQSNFIGTEFQIFCPTNNEQSSSSFMNEKDDRMFPPVSSPRSTDMNANNNDKARRRTRNFLYMPLSKRRQNNDNETAHGNRKGRITPWSSFSKKTVVRDKVRADPGSHCHDTEIGAITYTANLLGNRPRVMDICVPKVDEETGAAIRIPSRVETHEEGSILNNLKLLTHQPHNITHEGEASVATKLDELGLMSLQNRPPWWNVELGAFVLNFGGRVSVASVKNFQLCDRNDHDNIMLQFGRIEGRHSFTMDFSYPLSPLQAFAISVSSLQSKISFA